MLFGLLWPNTCFEMYFHCKYPSPIQQVLKTLFDWRSHLQWKVCHVNIKLLIWDYFIKCCTLFCKLSVWKTVKITGLQILCSIPCISYDDLPRRLKPVYKGSNPTLATWKKELWLLQEKQPKPPEKKWPWLPQEKQPWPPENVLFYLEVSAQTAHKRMSVLVFCVELWRVIT